MIGVEIPSGHPLTALFGGNVAPKPRPTIEAQIHNLRAFLERYQEPVHFKVGDIVTPTASSPLVGKGDPWMVIEVDAEAKPYFGKSESHSANFGQRNQIRLAYTAPDGEVIRFWNEACDFEPFVGSDPVGTS